MVKKIAYLIVNFGGPRNLEEIYPFLQSLLTDQDVVRTKLPTFLHYFLFTRIAKRRSKRISREYELMGGKSPLYEDTEQVAEELRKKIEGEILTFHRYIPATHPSFIEQIRLLDCDEIKVFPMFPQFTYATTGSIARWFEKKLNSQIVNKIRWIKSYPADPNYIKAQQQVITCFLKRNKLKEEEVALLFSAHGTPKSFMEKGDIYCDECEITFNEVMQAFPKAIGKLSFQSKFGPGEWLRPYTNETCEQVKNWVEERKSVVVVPVSFTSDHLETLVEIEEDYLPVLRERGVKALRVPALNLNEFWIEAIVEILKGKMLSTNEMLIRKN